MTALEIWGDVSSWGWLALAAWAGGWGLAGLYLGTWTERRHQDERITTAVRLAHATDTWGNATLSEIDKLTRALAQIDEHDQPAALSPIHPYTTPPHAFRDYNEHGFACHYPGCTTYTEDHTDGDELLPERPNPDTPDTIRIERIGPSCTCTISLADIADNGHLIGCPSRDAEVPPSQKHTPPTCLCSAPRHGYTQHHPECPAYTPADW